MATKQRKTQKAKRQAKKDKATTVNVVVKTQAVAVNKTKPARKRAPRRQAEVAPAQPAPAIYSSVFNTTPAPIIIRQPAYDFPVQYEPTKTPAIDVQKVGVPTAPDMPTPSLSTSTDFESPAPQERPPAPLLESMTKRMLYDYAAQNSIPGVTMKLSKAAMVERLRKNLP